MLALPSLKGGAVSGKVTETYGSIVANVNFTNSQHRVHSTIKRLNAYFDSTKEGGIYLQRLNYRV